MFTIGTLDFLDAQALHDYLIQGYDFQGEWSLHENLLHPIQCLINEGAGNLAYALFGSSNFELDLSKYNTFTDTIYSAFDYNTPANEKNIAFFRYLVSNTKNINKEIKGKTLLSHGFSSGLAPEFISLLIHAGCNINYKDNTNSGYLHQIIDSYWHVIIEETKLVWFVLLIEAGININQKNNDGETPLIYAIKKRNYQYIKTLMDYGADPNETDNYKCSAFYYVISYGDRNEAFDLMKKYAVPDFEMVNHYGETSFIAFMKRFKGNNSDLQLLSKLIEMGASFSQTATGNYGEIISAISLLANKSLEVLKFVLDKGFIDAHTKDNNGDTLLHKVCTSYTAGDRETAKNVYRKAKLLIDAGADPNALNNKNQTPTTLALLDHAKRKTVELLLAMS